MSLKITASLYILTVMMAMLLVALSVAVTTHTLYGFAVVHSQKTSCERNIILLRLEPPRNVIGVRLFYQGSLFDAHHRPDGRRRESITQCPPFDAHHHPRVSRGSGGATTTLGSTHITVSLYIHTGGNRGPRFATTYTCALESERNACNVAASSNECPQNGPSRCSLRFIG